MYRKVVKAISNRGNGTVGINARLEDQGNEYPDDYKPLMQGFRKYIINSYKTCPGPESTGKEMVYAGTARKPKAIYDITGQAKIMKRLIKWLSSSLMDRIVLSMYFKPSSQKLS